jgi:hypothetical protein
MQQVATSN